MTIQVRNIQRLRLYEEPNGSFATDHTGTLGDYIDVPAAENSLRMVLNENSESPSPLQQYIDGMTARIATIRDWTLDFTIPMGTLATKATDGVAASQIAVGRLLKIAMGGQRLGTGDTINDAGVAVTDFDVTTVARWAAGAALSVNSGTGGTYECREIKSISSSNLVLKRVLSNAPSNGAALRAAATYYLNLGDGDTVTSAQFIVEGLNTTDRWLLMGGQLASLTFDLTPGAIPKMTFGWKGTNWIDGSTATTDLSASALAAATYSASYIAVRDSTFYLSTVANTAQNIIYPSTITITPNIQYEAVRNPGADETVLLWVRKHAPPVVTGSFIYPDEDATIGLDTTSYALEFQIGFTTTGQILMTIPTAQVLSRQRIDVGGVAGQEVTWEARNDSETSEGTSSALGRSAMKIHLF